MIISNITLINIGAYKGFKEIELEPHQEKNVILIGGENGSGKTTLLNAIKLGLFGSYSFGYKTENEEYLNYVESLLNHDAKRNNENNFEIKIHFSIVEGYKRINYQITRQWKYIHNNLKETLYIIANGNFLDTESKHQFNNKMKEIMPPQLLDLCLFDGEQISRIVNEDRLSEYLKKLSKVVFNLDLFETLENDLERYSKQNLEVEKLETTERELLEATKQQKILRENITNKILDINILNEKIKKLEDEYYSTKMDFENFGGLVKQQREEIANKMHVIESERKQRQEEIKLFVSSILPFYIARQTLTDTRNQIKNESGSQLFKQLDAQLTDEKIESLAKNLSLSNSLKTNTLKRAILDILMPQNMVSQFQFASFSESSLIEGMFQKTKKNELDIYLNKLNKNKEQLQELNDLRHKLKINDTTSEFSEMISKMEKMNNTLQELKNKKEIHESILKEWKTLLDDIVEKVKRIQLILKNQEKTTSSFAESQKIISLSKHFRKLQLQKKLSTIQNESTQMLNRIFRKQNYINSIHIDSQTYEITLKDVEGFLIEKRTLSAGEKEILLISLIWAIFKTSGRKTPFIFDTLLGRLDKTHKATVLTEFIPYCGEQAIILSTDSEIDKEHYNLLKRYIVKEYHLEFDTSLQETTIRDRYFSFK